MCCALPLCAPPRAARLPMKSVAAHAVTLYTLLLRTQHASALTSGQHSRSPVERVVQLVEKLKDDLESDARKEELIYDKYACWCTATSKRKGAAIEKARADLTTMGSKILEMKGEVVTLINGIHSKQIRIQEDEVDMKADTLERQKEHNSYMALSGEYEQALTVLDKAGFVLGSGSLLQARSTDATHFQQAVASVSKVIDILPESTIGSLPPAKLALLKQFVADAAKLDGKAAASFTPQTSTLAKIVGTLAETLKSEHDTLKTEEINADRAYQDLMKILSDNVVSLQDEVKADHATMVETEAELASKEQLYDDITAQREADVEFFDTMEQNCKDKNTEWEERKSLRADELKGIEEALKILTADSARDIFRQAAQPGIATEKEQREYVPAVWEAETKTLNKTYTFLQVKKPSVNSATARSAKQHAFQVLKEQATRSHSLRLANLATKIRLAQSVDFGPVFTAIDGVIAELNEEEKQDMLKRDECTEKYKVLKSESADFNWKIEKNIAMIEKITGSIEDAKKARQETIDMIQEVTDEMTESTTQRDAAQIEYEAAKKLDEDAIQLLKDAKAALLAYWEKIGMKEAAAPVVKGALMQREPVFEVSPDQAPDANFTDKAHTAGQTKTLTSLLQKILEELENEIVVATSENQAQISEYDNFQAKGAKYKELLEKKKTALTDYITGKEGEKDDEETDKQGNEGSLKERTDEKAAITDDCDFIMGAWNERRIKRKAEMEGLVQAKAFLKGAELDG